MRKRKAKLITPFVMLFAGLVTSVAMYLRHYDLTVMLVILLIVLIVFYFVGDTFRYVYEKFRPLSNETDGDEEEKTKEIIADDDVEEEYHPLEDDETSDFSEDFHENDFDQYSQSDEDNNYGEATEMNSEDDFQDDEYRDSEEFEES